ncbi:glycosyltransferase family 4 protein [Plectonema cf. radiosum LEGE 06105]|uniref:Glycosyltransferase family 4 protein n=1 Tax=Plectonema cf. radiosum LEGE 06105 TaxID=945769 RepID=A0A8J7F074_9CYAN|nr:glycosyltransferase [Plectonema radiosum]MBE9213313.1 glycosyltransferase family 4 protein [Plectonema cf. radiosum LEGE 06105]
MTYHLALSSCFDLENIKQDAQTGKRPAHVIFDIIRLLNAKIHQPTQDFLLPIDLVYEKIIGSKHHWSLARKLSSKLAKSDIIFCTDESVGLPIATLCGERECGPKVVVFVHNLNRLRGRFALNLLGIKKRIHLLMTASQEQADFLRDYLKPENRVCLFPCQSTDASFFTPKLATPNKSRPLIVSGGLEQRDYRTLARATKSLNVDVKISATSSIHTVNARTFPKVIPANMSYRDYDWNSLVQLYCDADIVAIILYPNNFQAGLSTLFEALACRKPVIITRASGIIQELIDAKVVLGVNPGDYEGLHQAINSLLSNHKQGEAMAQRGYLLVHEQHNHHVYVKALVEQLRNI